MHCLLGDAEQGDHVAHHDAGVVTDHVEDAVVQARQAALREHAIRGFHHPTEGEVHQLHRLVERLLVVGRGRRLAGGHASSMGCIHPCTS